MTPILGPASQDPREAEMAPTWVHIQLRTATQTAGWAATGSVLTSDEVMKICGNMCQVGYRMVIRL